MFAHNSKDTTPTFGVVCRNICNR